MQENIGKWFESEVWKKTAESRLFLFDGRKQSGFMYRHRFQDAAAAGTNTVNQAPADFLFGWGGKAYLVECKASRVKENLRACFSMVSDGQVTSLTTWGLSGNPGFVLFYSEITGLVECWASSYVIEARNEGKPLPKLVPFKFPFEDLSKQFIPCLIKAALDLPLKSYSQILAQ